MVIDQIELTASMLKMIGVILRSLEVSYLVRFLISFAWKIKPFWVSEFVSDKIEISLAT